MFPVFSGQMSTKGVFLWRGQRKMSNSICANE
nr:MAG TPA: hypothetical protein [Caudoviricetes sp.]